MGGIPPGTQFDPRRNDIAKRATITFPEELRTNPHIQAAALADLAAYSTFTLEQEDTDEGSEKADQPIQDCYKVMGVARDSVFGDDVLEAILAVSTEMREVLIKAGLLRDDCAEAWQAEKVA